MRTVYQTAVLLAVILNRSEQNRARVSSKTIRVLAGRQNLRSAFVVELTAALAEFGWILFELASGGFGAVQAKALEAAKSATAKRLLTEEERRGLKKEGWDWAPFEREARPQQEDTPDEE
jgi:hypothetical protein